MQNQLNFSVWIYYDIFIVTFNQGDFSRVVSCSISQSLNQVSLVNLSLRLGLWNVFGRDNPTKHQPNHPICESLKRESGSPRMNHCQEFCFFLCVWNFETKIPTYQQSVGNL